MDKQRHALPLHLPGLCAKTVIVLALALVALCGCRPSTPASTTATGVATTRPQEIVPPEFTNPLVRAISVGDAGQVSRLLDAGADPNVSDEGETALQWAAGYSPFFMSSPLADGTMIRLLLAHGAHVNDRSSGGTALMKAAICREVTNMRVLIAHGADVNARDKKGRSALFWAVTFSVDNTAAVRLLLAHGAHVNTRDIYGVTPLGQAYRRHRQYDYPSFDQVIRLLKQAGART